MYYTEGKVTRIPPINNGRGAKFKPPKGQGEFVGENRDGKGNTPKKGERCINQAFQIKRRKCPKFGEEGGFTKGLGWGEGGGMGELGEEQN